MKATITIDCKSRSHLCLLLKDIILMLVYEREAPLPLGSFKIVETAGTRIGHMTFE